MAGPITAGVDGTDESLAALDWAAREALRRGLPLRLLQVWRFAPHEGLEGADAETQSGWVAHALAEVAEGVRARYPALDVRADAREGEAADTLVEAAAGSELLVLGSRGYGPVVGFLLGSVGQRVIAGAGRPVVLVRSGDRPAGEAAGREVVVGQQGDPDDSLDALRFAFATAAARGATVRAVRAWSLPPVFAYSPASLKLLDEAGGLEPYESRALTDALRPCRAEFPEVPVVEHVELGSAGQVLLSVASRAQLMVVGRRASRTAVGARIGSVAHGVLHHAECPVAVVPHG
ncbi:MULTISPECIES: universal stress protein [unclassified Streptomyces]|uniref:universal stress protein n=1 Tax=unclassified Streptomyces TaxID=2593676 RepID=UPI0033C5B093